MHGLMREGRGNPALYSTPNSEFPRPNSPGKDKPAEQRTRPPGKPFVHGYDRSVILLDLLFPKGERGDERNVEAFFYGHGEVIVCLPGNCNGMHQLIRRE
jgi:hypothetical protein